MLRKSPSFTAVCVLTIALGIGATTAIFSVVEATLLHPLPYPDPEQLVSLRADFHGVGANDVGISVPEWEDLQHSGIFQYVSPTQFDENNLTGSSQPARVRLLIVAPNYFALLGVRPQSGRAFFDPQDHSPGIIPAVVISDGLWKRAFGSDPNTLDKSIRMDTDLYRVVGIMPPGFDAPGRTAEERNIEIWAATNFVTACPCPIIQPGIVVIFQPAIRATEAGSFHRHSAEPARCPGRLIEETISRRLPVAKWVADSNGTAQGKVGW